MANTEYRPLVISLLLFGLFVIAIINASIFLSIANDSDRSLANDPSFRTYATNLNNSLQKAFENSNASQTALSQTPTTSTSGVVVILDFISGAWATLVSVPITIFRLTSELIFVNIFGSNQAFWIIFGTVSAIFILTIVLIVYKMRSTGETG